MKDGMDFWKPKKALRISRYVSPAEAKRRGERALLVPTRLDSSWMIDYALEYLACTGDFRILPSLLAQAEEADDTDIIWKAWCGRFTKILEGYVYFVESDAAPVIKIGFSAEPPARIQRLHFRWGDRCWARCWLPGGRLYETYLHRRFAHLRAEGEWFRHTDELESYIEAELEFWRAEIARAA